MPLIAIGQNRKMEDYLESVRRAGGEPIEVAVGSEAPEHLLARVDALVLTGGGDVDPAFYGQERHAATGDAEPGRDEFEIDLARRAMERNLPLLAICRGVQVLNVAAGGTLVQDIPTAIRSDLAHAVRTPKNLLCHAITIEPGTRLSRVLGSTDAPACSCRVNSRHHQAIDRVGTGLRVSAAAPDGVVEAVEGPDATFCIGVQWHPENFWRSGEFSPLFDAFVAAARETRSRP